MKVTTKGQVTIPQHIRRFLRISAHSDVDFQIRDEEVLLIKKSEHRNTKDHKSKFSALRGSKRDAPATDEWMGMTRGE